MTHSFNRTWLDVIGDILTYGVEVAPRGLLTREIPQRTLQVDMRKSVLTIPQRGLNYKLMATEAYRVITGRSGGMTPAHMAYGDKILSQLNYVVGNLIEDHNSRQAGLNTWWPSTLTTVTPPRVIAMFFNIRDGKLNCHVFMRSSNVWFNLPYDVFSYSMVGHMVCCSLHSAGVTTVEPGTLYVTSASSHIYEGDFERASTCYCNANTTQDQPKTPEELYRDINVLVQRLEWLSEPRSGGGDRRWWEGEACDQQ